MKLSVQCYIVTVGTNVFLVAGLGNVVEYICSG